MKTMHLCKSWDEIVDKTVEATEWSSSGRTASLGSSTPTRGKPGELPANVFWSQNGHLEITMCYPQIDQWINMTQECQQKHYRKLLERLLVIIRKVCPLAKAEYVFELFKSGQTHMHAVVDLIESTKFIPVGMISDLAKTYHTMMPIKKFHRYHLFDSKSLFAEMERYRHPSIVIQYQYPDAKDKSGESRRIVWGKYLRKAQINPDNEHL